MKMRSFMLNKLVRDKVFENMLAIGQRPHARQLNDKQLLSALRDKLLEEAKEFDLLQPGATKELADLLEVIESIGELLGAEFAELRMLQAKQRKKAGGFEKGRYVGRLDLDDTDPWVEYYAAEPDRFPEL